MKKGMFLVLLLISYTIVSAQVKIRPTVSQYSGSNYGAIQKSLNNRQASYDNNLNYSNRLITWATNLKAQTSESIFNDNIDIIINKIKVIQSRDLSQEKYNLSILQADINTEIDEYNKRKKELSKKEEELNTPLAHFKKGKEFFFTKQYNNSIIEFEKVLSTNPDEPNSNFFIAESYRNLNKHEEAIIFYKKAYIIKPKPLIAERLGWLYMKQKKYILAIEQFTNQIELVPNDEVGYYNRGSAKTELNDFYGAIKDYEYAIKLNEDFSMAYNNLSWLYFIKKEYDLAIVYADKSILKDKTNYVAWDSKSEILFQMGKYNECIIACNKAIELNIKSENSYFIKGRALRNLNKTEEACIAWSFAGQYGKKEAYSYISKYCK